MVSTARSETAYLLSADLQITDLESGPHFFGAKQLDRLIEVIRPDDCSRVNLALDGPGLVFCFHHCDNKIR